MTTTLRVRPRARPPRPRIEATSTGRSRSVPSCRSRATSPSSTTLCTADHDGGRRDQRRRWRQRQAGHVGRRRRRHVARRRRRWLDTLLTSDKVDAIVGPASSSTMVGIVDKIKTNGVVDVLGVEHLGRAHRSPEDGGLLLPHRAARQVAGAGARAAHPRATTRRRSRSSPGTTRTAPASRTRWSSRSPTAAPRCTTNAPYDPAATDFTSDVQESSARAPTRSS